MWSRTSAGGTRAAFVTCSNHSRANRYALNAGIREARGDVLAFMDDDVTVEPTWLQNLTAALDNGEWVGSGGRDSSRADFLAAPLASAPRSVRSWLPLLFSISGSQAGRTHRASVRHQHGFSEENV